MDAGAVKRARADLQDPVGHDHSSGHRRDTGKNLVTQLLQSAREGKIRFAGYGRKHQDRQYYKENTTDRFHGAFLSLPDRYTLYAFLMVVF